MNESSHEAEPHPLEWPYYTAKTKRGGTVREELTKWRWLSELTYSFQPSDRGIHLSRKPIATRSSQNPVLPRRIPESLTTAQPGLLSAPCPGSRHHHASAVLKATLQRVAPWDALGHVPGFFTQPVQQAWQCVGKMLRTLNCLPRMSLTMFKKKKKGL